MNPSAKSCSPIVSLHEMKWDIFVSRSTITHSALQLSTSRRPVMKSMEIESHGLVGNCRGLSNPNGACHIGLIILQVSQLSMY
jgi:hypothetical protein